MALATSADHQAVGPGTPQAKLHLARGAPRRTTETPPRSRAGRPSGETPPRSRVMRTLGRNSASLEGYAHPRAPSGKTPPRSRVMRTLGRISASLEGYAHPRAGLRLARGLCAPSGGFPPRSGVSRVRRSCTHSPDRSIKCSGTPRAPGSRTNPRHAGPLTPPGNHIPALFRQPLVRPSPPLYSAVR
jgi:hypothetical protein